MSETNTLRGEWPYAQTANCAVRRSAFEDVGGFRGDVRSGGDADLSFRLRRAGWKLESRQAAQVGHVTRTTVRAMVRQRARHGSGSAWLNELYPGSFPPGLRPGLLIWSISQLIASARHAARRERDEAISALLSPLSSLAFEVGRFLPNHARKSNAAQRRSG
jgi:GT2 family glycosyltransferase